MKQMFKHTLWIIFVLIFNIGCTLTSRETVDLEYKESKLLETLARGPFKSLEPGGNFNKASHNVWDFDVTNMEATIYVVEELTELQKVIYTFDIIEDVSIQEGVIRLYGAGPNNDKYVGISALTNADGAFLKFSIQDKVTNAVSAASDKPFWEYASDPTIFRTHATKYLNQDIVSLDADGFFEASLYTNMMPIHVDNGVGVKQLVFKRTEITTDAETGVETKTPLADIIVTTTTVIPANTEIYTITIDGTAKFVGIEYYPDKTKTVMKFIIADSFEEAKNAVTSKEIFGWDLKINAKISNKAIRLLSEHQMVKLTKVSEAVKDADYFWDKTDELIFDADEMTLNIITTLDLDNSSVLEKGITNYLSYDLEMIKKEGDTAGIFKIKGAGKYNDSHGLVYAMPIPDTDIMYADFEVVDTKNEAESALERIIGTPTYKYQDKDSARRPYRLIETMNAIGHTWVKLKESADGTMSYDPTETERYTFVDLEKRTLEYTFSSKGTTTAKSYYKVKIVVDNNNTNGVLLLEGVGPDFVTPNTSASMHNKYIAIERGPEIYKMQAKHAVGDSLEEAQVALTKVPLFNLHENTSIDSDYSVIASMGRDSPWVALVYDNDFDPGIVPGTLPPATKPAFDQENTYQLTFDTIYGPEVSLVEIEGTTVKAPSKYKLEVIEEYSDTCAVFKVVQTVVGTDGPTWQNQYMAVKRGIAFKQDKAYLAIANLPDDAKDELDRLVAGDYYNYQVEKSVKRDVGVIKTIQGIPYIQSETNTPDGSLFGLPTGDYIPYHTRYYTFSYDELTSKSTLTIDTIHSVEGKTTDVYNIINKQDRGDFSGIIELKKASGDTSSGLDGYNLRIDVQKGDQISGEGAGDAIRILLRRDIKELADNAVPQIPSEDQNEFPEDLATHINNNKFSLPNEALQALVAIDTRWTAVDDYDKLYDYRNGQELVFDITAKTVRINTLLNGEDSSDNSDQTYSYTIMEDNPTSTEIFNSVIQLSGVGLSNDYYVALQYVKPTVPDRNNNVIVAPHGVKFAFGKDSYNQAKSQLLPAVGLDPYIPYYDPYTDDGKPELNNAFRSYLKKDIGYGTPSFVWMKNNVFLATDTETWIFNDLHKTVSVIHNDVNNPTIDYSVQMLEADATTTVGTLSSRDSALFYLRATINPATSDAPYNRRYVRITNHKMYDLTADARSESTFYAAIDEDRANTENTTSIASMTKLMRDRHTAGNALSVMERARQQIWVRLDDTMYQLNKDKNETWIFGPEDAPTKIRVINQAGDIDTYGFIAKDSISDNRGVFTLFSPLDDLGPYNNHMVVIDIGAEDSTINSMKLVTKFIDIEDESQIQASIIATMENLPEWNFRNKTLAETPFTPIMKAVTFDPSWVRMNKVQGIYVYESTDTEHWDFNTLGSENVSGSAIHDMGITITDIIEISEGNYGIKLIEIFNDTKAIFQIFKGDRSGTDVTRLNKFVVLELGVGANEKLMRVGIGANLTDAKTAFGILEDAGEYNWSSLGRANANYDIIINAQDRGEWALTRDSSSDTAITGSAISTEGVGHLEDADSKPEFDKIDRLEYVFKHDVKLLSVFNKKGPQETTSVMTMDVREIPNPQSGIYLLRSSGSSSSYDKQFMYLQFNDEYTKGKVSVAGTLEAVKTMNQTLNDKGTWNLFTTDSIKISEAVFIEAANRQRPEENDPSLLGAYVELGFNNPPYLNIYDPELTRSYTIISDETNIGAEIFAKKTIIISNIALGVFGIDTRADKYTYEMIDSHVIAGQQMRAVALLTGEGPDNGQYIGIRLPIMVNNDEDSYGSIILADTELLVKRRTIEGGIDWHTAIILPELVDRAFRYRNLKDIVSKSLIIETLRAATANDKIVTLDDDGIYLDHETKEWSFSATELKAIVETRDLGGMTTNTNTIIYKIMEVKSEHEVPNKKGILYFKGSERDIYNELYAAVIISDDGDYSFKFSGSFEDAEGNLQASQGKISLALKSKVHFPTTDSLIAGLIKPGKWSSLNESTFEQIAVIETTNFTFLDKRIVKVKVGSANEVKLRFKPVHAEGNSGSQTAKAMIQLVSADNGLGGSTAVPDAFRGRTIALAVHDLAINEALRFTVSADNFDITDSEARNALILARDETLKDPNYMIDTIYENDNTISSTLEDAFSWFSPVIDETVMRWYLPVDETGVVLSDVSLDDNTKNTFAFSTTLKQNTPIGRNDTYNFNVGERYIDATRDLRGGGISPPPLPVGPTGPDGSGIVPVLPVPPGGGAGGGAIPPPNVEPMPPSNDPIAVKNSVRYLTKVIQDGGENPSVIQTYGIKETLFGTLITNQYIALQVGKLENEQKVKLARGTTKELALANLKALTHWNYAPKFVVGATPRVTKSLATDMVTEELLEWIQTDGQEEDPTYISSTTTNWGFTEDGKNVIIHDVVNNATNISAYSIRMVRDVSTKEGVFQLYNIGGIYNGHYMAVRIIPTFDTLLNKFIYPTARVAIRPTAEAAVLARDDKTALPYVNFYRKSDGKLVTHSLLVKRLQESGAIGSLSIGKDPAKIDPMGYYDPNNTTQFNFFYKDRLNTLTVVDIKNGIRNNYSFKIESVVVGAEVENNTTGTFKVTAADAASYESSLHDNYLRIEFLSDNSLINDRLIMAVGASPDNAKNTVNAHRARETEYPLSFWTHELLKNTAISKAFIKDMIEISSRKKKYPFVTDWNINNTSIDKDTEDFTGTLGLQSHGLRMLSDTQYYKHDGGGGISRAKGNGYYDIDAHYKLAFYNIDYIDDGVSTDNGTRLDIFTNAYNLDGTAIAPTGHILRQYVKVLEYEDSSNGVFLAVTGPKTDGTVEDYELKGSLELNKYFQNTVFAFNIGSNDIITFGNVKPNSGSTADMQVAINSAKFIRDDRLEYNPGPMIVPDYIALQQKFIPSILQTVSNSMEHSRTFVTDYGGTEDLHPSGGGFQDNNTGQLSMNFYRAGGGDDEYGPTNNFYAELDLKPHASIGKTNETTGIKHEFEWENKTKFMIQTYISTKEKMVFKFHSPNNTNSAFSTVYHWIEMSKNNFHVMELGTGANMFQHRWAHGNTIQQAEDKLPIYYNGSFANVSTKERRNKLDEKFMGKKYTIQRDAAGSTPDMRRGKYQRFEGYFRDDTKRLELTAEKIGDTYFLMIEQFDQITGGAYTEMRSYPIYLKHIATGTDSERMKGVAFAIDGFGPLEGLFMFFGEPLFSSYTQGQMIMLKPENALDFYDAINGIILDVSVRNTDYSIGVNGENYIISSI